MIQKAIVKKLLEQDKAAISFVSGEIPVCGNCPAPEVSSGESIVINALHASEGDYVSVKSSTAFLVLTIAVFVVLPLGCALVLYLAASGGQTAESVASGRAFAGFGLGLAVAIAIYSLILKKLSRLEMLEILGNVKDALIE